MSGGLGVRGSGWGRGMYVCEGRKDGRVLVDDWDDLMY